MSLEPDSQILRVLVVDDEHPIADSLVLVLKARGHDARAVYSAEEAIALADMFKPQAVLSDVMMAGLSGIDLAIHFEEQAPDCKVLLMSGYATAFAMIEESIRRGHYHTIFPKPIHPDEVFKFLASCAPQA